MASASEGIAKMLSQGGDDDDDQGLTASQIMAAEDLIKELQDRYEHGPPRPSRVARAMEALVKATLRNIETDDG